MNCEHMHVIASKAKQSRLGTWGFLLERRNCFASLAMTLFITDLSCEKHITRRSGAAGYKPTASVYGWTLFK